MFKRIIIRIRKYICDKLVNSEIKRLIREKAALNEEYDSYIHDASTAMDLLCEDKRVLQEKVKKLEQESKYFASDRDAIAKRYEDYISKLKADFDRFTNEKAAQFRKREDELMIMLGRAEANCKIAEARYTALDDALHEYVVKLETECGDCAIKLRAEDDLK